MKMNQIPSADFLNERFEYEPETGELFYRYKISRNVNINKPVGTLLKNKNRYKEYKYVQINGKFYFLHRLIYKMHNPEWDGNEMIDHIDNVNGIQNNKIDNLRLSSHSQNGLNKGKQNNNKSGFKGVYWYKNRNKWHSKIGHKNKKIHIGYFDDIEEAAKAYDIMALELYGEHAVLNFPQDKSS